MDALSPMRRSRRCLPNKYIILNYYVPISTIQVGSTPTYTHTQTHLLMLIRSMTSSIQTTGQPASGGKFWPHVSSSFGSFDLSGFAKAPAWWYRSWWLAAVDILDAGRPPLPAKKTRYFCRLVESWQPVPHSSSNTGVTNATAARRLHVYTNAPFARVSLFFNYP